MLPGSQVDELRQIDADVEQPWAEEVLICGQAEWHEASDTSIFDGNALAGPGSNSAPSSRCAPGKRGKTLQAARGSAGHSPGVFMRLEPDQGPLQRRSSRRRLVCLLRHRI